MLYVFYGTDGDGVTKRRLAFLHAIRAKRAEVNIFSFDTNTLTATNLDEVLYAQGLFFQKHVIVLDGVFEHEDLQQLLFERVEMFAETEHVIIVSSGALDAKVKKILKTHAHEMREYKKEKKETNAFALAEALAKKNTRLLWYLCVEQLRAGTEPEALVGMLHWQVRMLLLAKQGISPEEAGIKPFVMQKAKQNAKRFDTRELTQLSFSLVKMYHDAHRGFFPLATGVERWCLSVK